jgi:methylmalonyl-CoA mutase cobalamin-binding subunit
MTTQPPEETPDAMLPGSGTPSRPLGRTGNTSPNTNWGRRTGGLGRTSPVEPPDLRRYSTMPRYDMATIADLVGVRAVTLWAWEQNLGVIAHDPAAEAATGLRYSERDLIVLIWLRDQIVAGVDPLLAAQKLREAIVAAGGTPPAMPTVPRTPSRPLGSPTGRLLDPTLNPPSRPYPRADAPTPDGTPVGRVTPENMPLVRGTDAPIGPGSFPSMRPDSSVYPPSMPYTRPVDPAQASPSRPMQGPPSMPMSQHPSQRLPDAMSGSPSMPMSQHPSQRLPDAMPMSMPASQPITRGVRGSEPSQPISRIGASRHTPESVMPQSQPHVGGQVISQTWVGAMPSRDLRTLVQPLMQAFAMLDAPTASRLLDDAFMSRSVETTCLTLVAPALARIQELWMRKEEPLAEGLFGMNVLRSRLFRLFDVLPENASAPLTFVATGPDEPHEINALMLALFWRRIGLRVVYFGQGATGQAVVASARKLRPRVIGLTVTTPARARLIGQMNAEISKFEVPRPNVCLVGDVLARDPALRKKMGGIYLGADAGEATQQVRQFLRAIDSR